MQRTDGVNVAPVGGWENARAIPSPSDRLPISDDAGRTHQVRPSLYRHQWQSRVPPVSSGDSSQNLTQNQSDAGHCRHCQDRSSCVSPVEKGQSSPGQHESNHNSRQKRKR